MDYNKRTILPAAYDKIHAVYDSQIMAEKDGKSGVVSFQGKTLIPLIYDRIAERFRNGNYRTGKAIAPLKWLYGMVDTAGRILLEQEYESVEQCYHSDFFRVGRQGKKGLVGATGQLQIPIQYGEIYELKHPDWTEQPGQPRYVNREAYGLYFKTRNTQNDLLGLWQLGKGEILKPEYQGIDILLVGGPYSVQQNDKKALFSGAGQQLTGFDYTWLGYGPMRPEVISAGLPEQKMTLLRLSDGKPVEPEVYDEILPIRDTDTGYMVSKNGGKWALHAPNGKRLTLHQYTWIRRWDKEQQIDGLPPGRVLIAQSAVYADKGPQFFALDDAGGEYPTDGWGR
ncbi:MAG: WG repeat-containing protein [Lewinellaceae bacterium]|nr:WG repeat-containing protein [Lewinellaceae bacterium]